MLGIVGGGQLARMLAQAASTLGVATRVLERSADVPAASVTAAVRTGDWDDPAALLALGREVDAVTLENEFVEADSLLALERAGIPLWPGTETIRAIQDKFRQREVLRSAGLPVPQFAAVEGPDEIREWGTRLGWPLMLKARRNGYDGKGNCTVRGPDEVDAAWRHLGSGRRLLLVEQFCHFRKELAVMVCRGRDGRMAVYPVVETIQRDHICHVVKAPAGVSDSLARRAAALARQAVRAFDGVGCLGVELFLTRDDRLVVNELAPRVHNSGHYTIEACECSQFENHVRAVLGLPLGSTAMRSNAAVMINLLGGGDGPGQPRGLPRALAVPGAHVHLYGKARSARGRKMGHVTALGDTPAAALRRARRAAEQLDFGDSP